MAELAIRAATYRPGVHGVTQTWKSGQMVGIVGPNGAGKSTLLRLAAGIWQPDDGAVLLDGQTLRNLNHRDRARRIAYLPQQLPHDAAFTVAQYVEMGRYAHRRGFLEKDRGHHDVVRRALARMNLDMHADVPLDRLSGGERQRVALARCLAQESDVLLLDEPISNLDLYYQMEILNHLRTLVHEGFLVVLAIHNLEMAAQYCTHLALLDHGRLVASGPPQAVLTESAIRDVFRVGARAYFDPNDGALRFTFSPLDLAVRPGIRN